MIYLLSLNCLGTDAKIKVIQIIGSFQMPRGKIEGKKVLSPLEKGKNGFVVSIETAIALELLRGAANCVMHLRPFR